MLAGDWWECWLGTDECWLGTDQFAAAVSRVRKPTSYQALFLRRKCLGLGCCSWAELILNVIGCKVSAIFGLMKYSKCLVWVAGWYELSAITVCWWVCSVQYYLLLCIMYKKDLYRREGKGRRCSSGDRIDSVPCCTSYIFCIRLTWRKGWKE